MHPNADAAVTIHSHVIRQWLLFWWRNHRLRPAICRCGQQSRQQLVARQPNTRQRYVRRGGGREGALVRGHCGPAPAHLDHHQSYVVERRRRQHVELPFKAGGYRRLELSAGLPRLDQRAAVADGRATRTAGLAKVLDSFALITTQQPQPPSTTTTTLRSHFGSRFVTLFRARVLRNDG